MKLEDVAKELTGNVERLRKADENVSEVPAQAIREVAAGVKGMAQRAGHRIDVRVVSRGNGVRLTVVGQHAAHYRKLVNDELARRTPQVQAEVRARVTGRAR